MTRYTTLDLPHIRRASVGFDQLFEEMDKAFANTKSTGYPPYNIVQHNENHWTISLAVAGFDMDSLDITLEQNLLTVEGTAPTTDEDVQYLHKGIATRAFRRQFTLADHVEVESAELELGMLSVNLKRNVPEEMQPKRISINSTAKQLGKS